MLRHPYILGGSQSQEQGTKSEVAASPLPSRRPKEGRNAMPPLHSRGSPTKGSKIRSGCLTPAFSGAQKRAEMLRHPYMFGCPQSQGRGTKSEVPTSPLHSRGSPTPSAGNKSRSGCLTPAFSGARKKEEMLRHPCIRGGPQHQARGTKSEVAASPLPSRGPNKRRKCSVPPTFSGVPNTKRGEQNQKWLPHPCILGDPQRQVRGTKAEVDASPLPSRGPKKRRKCYVTLAFSGVPNTTRREQNQKWLPHPCLLGGPKKGGNATCPLHSRGSPTPSAGNKIRIGCSIPAFSGAQKRAEMLRHPCILRCPQNQAQRAKSEVAASPLPSWGPKRRRKCYASPAF